MAFATQVLENGQRNYVIKVVGTAPDAAALLVDVSAIPTYPCALVQLMRVQYDVAPGSLVSLLWDASTDVTILTMSEGPGQTLEFRDVGGLVNNAGAGVTGDVMITSTGAAIYTLILWFVKSGPIIPL